MKGIHILYVEKGRMGQARIHVDVIQNDTEAVEEVNGIIICGARRNESTISLTEL